MLYTGCRATLESGATLHAERTRDLQEICARYGYVDINRFIKKLLRLALETAMIKAVSTFDLLSHVEMEACQQPLPECEWK